MSNFVKGVSHDLQRIKKTFGAMKAKRIVNRITFNPSEANPGETLYVAVPKLSANEVIVPDSLALRFDIDLSGGHANNFLVQNVSRALVEKLVVKFSGDTLQETEHYDIYKTFSDLFLPGEMRDKMLPEGIQSEDLCKIRSNSGDKKTSGVEAEKKLNEVFGARYRINFDHEILKDHGVFYPHALTAELVFLVKLAPANQVVKGTDPSKLKYKLTNIHLEYEMIVTKELANFMSMDYELGRSFLYDHVMFDKIVPIKKGTDGRINIRVNAQRRSMKGILLLFIEPYIGGARDSEKYVFPDLKKVRVTVNGKPNMLYNDGIQSEDIWAEVSRFFMKEEHKPQFMTLQKFYTDDKFGLLIDLRSMASQEMHGSGTRLVDSTDGVQLEIEREKNGSGTVNCHVFIISDAQFIIQQKQFESMRSS